MIYNFLRRKKKEKLKVKEEKTEIEVIAGGTYVPSASIFTIVQAKDDAPVPNRWEIHVIFFIDDPEKELYFAMTLAPTFTTPALALFYIQSIKDVFPATSDVVIILDKLGKMAGRWHISDDPNLKEPSPPKPEEKEDIKPNSEGSYLLQ